MQEHERLGIIVLNLAASTRYACYGMCFHCSGINRARCLQYGTLHCTALHFSHLHRIT